ncbi:hypothetical protein GCM10011389_22750 [Pontibacillus salipaludis]|uniref:Uncharacterized protein n=1 Tax=Pontibacillus salipaludis TaxID=1697394 RepID=A0ABQ1Q5S6_9BACI|nr:hypothetical protein GCM10011389_22750 [Pontibacillus salipaludis]
MRLLYLFPLTGAILQDLVFTNGAGKMNKLGGSSVKKESNNFFKMVFGVIVGIAIYEAIKELIQYLS